MKKHIYIASIFASLLVFSACQKDELEQMGVNNTPLESEAKMHDAEATHSDKTTGVLKDRVKKVGEIDIMVKEVSDGDEESDDDESNVSD